MKRPRPTHVRPLATLYRKHRGELVFVLGNSASLNGMDLSALSKYTTIGVNRILRMFTPTYVFAVDKSIIKDEHERMMKSRATKIIYKLAMGERQRALYPGPYVEIDKMSCAGPPTTITGPIHICRGGNSAYEACHLAFRMGAACIALAGVDMYWPKKGATHFFGSGSQAGCRMDRPNQKVEDFRDMKRLYRKKGVEMVSVSPWRTGFSATMEQIPLEKLLGIYALSVT